MRRLLPFVISLFVCAPLFAQVDPKLDRAVRDALPVCADAKVTFGDVPLSLPPRFTARLVEVESPSHTCEGQYVAVTAPSGAFFLGSPWPIAQEEGKTIEEKLKNFTWRNMREAMTATVERKHNADGLFPVTLAQVTESGTMPIRGLVDPEGKIFFFGAFRPANTDTRAARMKAFETYVANSPSKGTEKARVTIVEFSDFQCPSCARATNYVDPILAKHGDNVRYVRFDLPLAGHAWAFPAALAGRAIHRQKPELFWEYKKQVYANQGELNPFTFWDWARAWAEDHDLDLKKYDADLASQTIKDEILAGAGLALSTDIRATPSYLVNGALVSAGTDGKDLATYVDSLLSK
ncbi:MAG TPA: thioredoxin domain-containing protein [Thermoanaerobaculia bacterium]|nr:thioredoxin domain-containing protein [Thermoanaerobaculia bacterium]